MGMDKDSNAYTFLFAGGLVVVVGALLASASMGLKRYQVQNVKNAKMQDILEAANIKVNRPEAQDRFMKTVKKRVVVDSMGNVINAFEGSKPIKRKNDSTEAFNIEPRAQLKNMDADSVNRYAVFILENDGKEQFIVPMAASGLWGQIWGYVSLKSDMRTIAGAVFDHKTETPGLGAEIAKSKFQGQFKGKKLFSKDIEDVKFGVMKNVDPKMKDSQVDGITGGTVASKGVHEMINRTFEKIKPYFKKKGKKAS